MTTVEYRQQVEPDPALVPAQPPVPPSDPNVQRLKELRSARAKLEDAREARSQPSVEEQIALEERKLATEQKLIELEQQHGKVGKEIDLVESEVGTVIVKRPTMNVFRRYQDSGTTETKDWENLVRPCVLYPTRDEFDAMVERKPMLLAHCANACIHLAGLRAQDIKKK